MQLYRLCDGRSHTMDNNRIMLCKHFLSMLFVYSKRAISTNVNLIKARFLMRDGQLVHLLGFYLHLMIDEYNNSD